MAVSNYPHFLGESDSLCGLHLDGTETNINGHKRTQTETDERRRSLIRIFDIKDNSSQNARNPFVT